MGNCNEPPKTGGTSVNNSEVIIGRENGKTGSTTLAWCLSGTNEITIHDMQNSKSFTSFPGCNVSPPAKYHLETIPGTGLVVSASTTINAVPEGQNQNVNQITNFEIFDFNSQKRVFDFGITRGCTNDIAYNRRHNIMLLTSTADASYHVFDCDSLEIVKRQKLTAHRRGLTSLSIEPLGEAVATIDAQGICVITHLDTEKQLNMSTTNTSSSWSKCRWNPNPDIDLIAFKSGRIGLQLYDSVKFSAVQNAQLQDDFILSFDWHPEGNLLAMGGSEENVKIIDVRKGAAVKAIDKQYGGWIQTLRWSPNGSSLAIGAQGNSVQVMDFRSLKTLFKAKTPNHRKAVL